MIRLGKGIGTVRRYAWMTVLAAFASFGATPADAATFEVKFETFGGSTVFEQTVDETGSVVRPADPTWGGCTFGDWYTDTTFTTAWDFTASPTANMTLYAMWTTMLTLNKAALSSPDTANNADPVNCGIFTINGVDTSSTPVTVGTNVTITAAGAVGYRYMGWSDGVAAGTRTIAISTANPEYTAAFKLVTTYYVSPNGTGTGYTVDDPTKLDAFLDTFFYMKTTDTLTHFNVKMAAGTYTFSSYVNRNNVYNTITNAFWSGSNSAVIDQHPYRGLTIEGAPNLTTIIKGQFIIGLGYGANYGFPQVGSNYTLRNLNFDWTGLTPSSISANNTDGDINKLFYGSPLSSPAPAMIHFLGGRNSGNSFSSYRGSVATGVFQAARYARNVIVEGCRFANLKSNLGSRTGFGLYASANTSVGANSNRRFDDYFGVDTLFGVRVFNSTFENIGAAASFQSAHNVLYDSIRVINCTDGIVADNNHRPFGIQNSYFNVTGRVFAAGTGGTSDAFYGGIFRNNVMISSTTNTTNTNLFVLGRSNDAIDYDTQYMLGLFTFDNNILIKTNSTSSPFYFNINPVAKAYAKATAADSMNILWTNNYYNGYDPRDFEAAWKIIIKGDQSNVTPYHQVRYRADAGSAWSYGMLDSALKQDGETELLQHFGNTTVTTVGGTNANWFGGKTIADSQSLTGKSGYFAELGVGDRHYGISRGSAVPTSASLFTISTGGKLTLADISLTGNNAAETALVSLSGGELNVGGAVSISGDANSNLFIDTGSVVTLREPMANGAGIRFTTGALPRENDVPVAVPTTDYAAQFALASNTDIAKFAQDAGVPSSAYKPIYATNASGENTAIVLTTYRVGFVTNGGTPAQIDTQYIFPDDQTPAVKPADPALTDHRFEGWFTDAALTNKWNFSDPVNSSMVLYAKWVRTFTVSFHANGGSAVASQIVDSGALAMLPAQPTRPNHLLEGWYLDDGTFLDPWRFSDSIVVHNVDLYAKWGPMPLTITYHDNFSTDTYAQTVYYQVRAALDPVAFAHQGYRFMGWNTASDSTGTPYADGASITLDTHLNLYAQWQGFFTVTTLDMVAYEKGSSLSQDPFPRPYFNCSIGGVNLEPDSIAQLLFRIDGVDYDPVTKMAGGVSYADTFLYEIPYRADFYFNGIKVDDKTVDTFGVYDLLASTWGYDVTVIYNGITHVSLIPDTNYLDVREVTDGLSQTNIQYTMPTAPVTAATAVVPPGTRFTNSAGLVETDTRGISLLRDRHLDSIVDSLYQAVRSNPASYGKGFVSAYLDLVDSHNGNILVASGEPVTVVMPYPYPSKMDALTPFEVIHFKGENRSNFDFSDAEILAAAGTANGIQFTTSTFSPFVLIYPNVFTVSSVADTRYDGLAKTPTPEVRDYYTDSILIEGIDYTLTYTNNVNAGIATVTVNGLDTYLGTTAAVDFNILPRQLTIIIDPDTVYAGQPYVGTDIDSRTGIGSEFIRYKVVAPNYNTSTGAGVYLGYLQPIFDWNGSSALAQNYDINVIHGTLTVLKSGADLHLHAFPNYCYDPDSPIVLRTHVHGAHDAVLTYTSSDESVVRVVNNDYLLMTGVGTAIITVRSAENALHGAGVDTQQIVIGKGRQRGVMVVDQVSKTAYVDGLKDNAGYWLSTNNNVAVVYGDDATFGDIIEVGRGKCNFIFVTAETALYESTQIISAQTYTVGAPQYSITVINGSSNVDSAAEGTLIHLTAVAPDTERLFARWVVSPGVEIVNPYDEAGMFIMPAQNVVVIAEYKRPGEFETLGVRAIGDTVYLTTDSFGIAPEQEPLNRKTRLQAKYKTPYKEYKTRKLPVKMTDDNTMMIKGKLLLINMKNYNLKRKYGDFTRDILAADSVVRQIQRDSMIVSLQTVKYSDMLHFHMGLPVVLDSALTADSLYWIVKTEHAGSKTRGWLEYKNNPNKRVKRLKLKALKPTKWMQIQNVRAVGDALGGEVRVFKISPKALMKARATAVGGRLDAVIDNRNGYIAEPFEQIVR